ncbi:MAG: PilZ domain-containing protein [Desulfovibrionaceae bacterium]|nr:PilZ domain-containing protein [Desulfovibrionaceae bacterium]
MTERRNNPRIPLEDILYIHIASADRNLSSVLLDISVSGARLGLPPNEVLPPVGSEVVFTDTALLAPFLENRKATVLWGVGVQFGVCFTQQINARIEDIAELLRSEIFYS